MEYTLSFFLLDMDFRVQMREKKHQNLLDLSASDILTKEPKTIFTGELAEKSLQIMETYKITSLFIVKKEFPKKPVGIIHLHSLLKAKIV